MNYSELIAKNVACVPPSGIRKFFDIASEMKDCISLGVGEPDFITPWHIRESAIYSIENGATHYTSNWGMTELRQMIIKYLKTRYDIEYDYEQVLVTVGASEALDLAFRAVINPGDEVLIPAPSYVSYFPGVSFCGGKPVCIQTLEEDQFKINPDELKKVITKNTKAIVLPYPNNPTGAIMTKQDYEQIADIIIENDLLVISDEIYSELTYAGGHTSIVNIAGMKDRTLLINGFSKAFAMTGWRLGYVCGPQEILDAMCKIHQYSMLCAPTSSQMAGLAALSGEMENGFTNVNDMKREYNRRRTLAYTSFNRMGLNCFEPLGAFYVFPNITSTGLSSEEFCERLIRSQRVACVPGNAFGQAGEGYIRCSYASSIENIKEAILRIAKFLKEIKYG